MSIDGISRDGRFGVLAIDHRDSLRQFLAPLDPESITPAAITELKRDIVSGVADHVTGVMLEPEFSIPHSSMARCPTGSDSSPLSKLRLSRRSRGPADRHSRWLVGGGRQGLWRGRGQVAAAIPPDRSHSQKQEQVLREVVAECRRVGIPLVLEPLFYAIDDQRDRGRIVIDTVDRLAGSGADVLKLPFPAAVERSARVGRPHAVRSRRAVRSRGSCFPVEAPTRPSVIS